MGPLKAVHLLRKKAFGRIGENMKYIKDLKEGDRVFDIYLCKHKQSAVTKNGKAYDNVILQDKTGTIDAKYGIPTARELPNLTPWTTLRYTAM